MLHKSIVLSISEMTHLIPASEDQLNQYFSKTDQDKVTGVTTLTGQQFYQTQFGIQTHLALHFIVHTWLSEL